MLTLYNKHKNQMSADTFANYRLNHSKVEVNLKLIYVNTEFVPHSKHSVSVIELISWCVIQKNLLSVLRTIKTQMHCVSRKQNCLILKLVVYKSNG